MTKTKIMINNFRNYHKKTYNFILLILFIPVWKIYAQQVTKVDCCLDVATKATIITNSTANNINTNSITTNGITTGSLINSICNFRLSASANTSAGIFDSSGTLIRTLWSGIYYDVGCYNLQWDGMLDDGTSAPSGTYIAKVLTHSVNYTLEGGIGNTSSNLNDATTHKGFAPIASGGLAFSSTKGYYGEQFVEGGMSTKAFYLNNIQSKNDVNTVSALVTRMCTDGTNIYWALNDQYHDGGPSTFVYTSKIADDSQVAFTNASTTVVRGTVYSNALDYRATGNDQIVAVAVQKTGNFLFTKRTSADSITFTNKITGAFVSKISFPGVLNIAGENTNLWVSKAGTIERFTVNSNGTLATTGTTISMANPGQMAVSPDNSTLAILDMATHQVKGFSTSNGSMLWVLGSLNGFVGNPAVTNYKFYFNDVSACIAYQPNGSLWVNDYGSYRLMHYDANRNYIEQIQYIPASRSTNIDLNDPTRYFADELEFKRDYSKPLDNGVNGSWIFANNWKPNTQLDVYQKFKQVATLSNGHTYAIGSNGDNVYDLTANGAVFVGNVPGYGGEVMEADGSLTYRNILNSGATVQMAKQPLTGFAGNFMPQWGNGVAFATIATTGLPINYNNNTKGSISNPNKYFFFQPNTYPGFHLAGVTKTGVNDKWLWQASKSTFSKYYDSNNQHVEGTARDYSGDYPRNGDFDIGNNNGPGPQHSENCQLWVNGSNLIWNVNGEFWKDGYEINIINHFNEDGLFIGDFGKTYIDAGVTGNAGYAGNAYSTALTKANGNLYFTECDESQHGSVMCWAITGLATIQEQSIPITLGAAPALATDATNLMGGLPYNSFFYGGNGWAMVPNVGNNQDGQYPQWAVRTTQNTYQKNDMDIWFESDNSNLGDRYITRSLGSNNSNNWVLSGYLLNQNGNVNWEVLDGQGKILAQLTLTSAGNKVNGIDVGHYTDQNVNKNFIGLFQKFVLMDTNGQVTFQYANYPPVTIPAPLETGANFNTPTTFRVRPYGSGGSKGIGSVKGLRFTTGLNL